MKNKLVFLMLFVSFTINVLLAADIKTSGVETLTTQKFMSQTYDKSLSNTAKADRLKDAAKFWREGGRAAAIAEYGAIIAEYKDKMDPYSNSLCLAAQTGLLKGYLENDTTNKDREADLAAAKKICADFLASPDAECYVFFWYSHWFGNKWAEAYLRLASLEPGRALEYYRILINDYQDTYQDTWSGEYGSDACNTYAGYALNSVCEYTDSAAAITMLRESLPKAKTVNLQSHIQYTIGYIYENKIRDYNMAIKEYKKGIEKYAVPFNEESDRMNFTVESKNRIEWINKKYQGIERDKKTGQYICTYGNKKVTVTLDTDEALSGRMIVHDNNDFSVIDDLCGPSVVTKYNAAGVKLFTIEEGAHAHSFGALAPKKGFLYIFHLEDREIHGRSIRVYTWDTGKRVKIIPITREAADYMWIDGDEEYLHLGGGESMEEKIKI